MQEEYPLADYVSPDSDNVIPFTGTEQKKGETFYTPPQDEETQREIAASSAAGLRKVSSIIEVMEDDEKLSFIIEDLLPDTGLMYIGGISGTGKTILAIQIVANIVQGRPTMAWKLGEKAVDIRALMLSLEMPKKELQLRLNHMIPDMTDDEKKIFDEFFLTYTDSEPFELWNPVHVVDLIKLIGHYKINLLLIDSASVSFGESLKDDKQVNAAIRNLYMIRSRMNVAMIIVSHTRKPPAGIVSNPEDVTINELFGHSGVAQSASSIIIVVEDEKARKAAISPKADSTKIEKVVHIINAKARFGSNAGVYSANLTSKIDVDNGKPLQFFRNAIPLPPMTAEQKQRAKSIQPPTMKDTLAGIDFTHLIGDDDEDEL